MLTFSSQEIKDIVISTVVLAFVFQSIAGDFITSLIVMSVVFLTHELLGHKLVAQHFGCFAEYRKWTSGLILAVIGSFLGFIFAAPGAVYIRPTVKKGFAWTIHRLTSKQMGLIAIAGPAVNIIFGFTFIILLPYSLEYASLVFLAARFSFFLALFNLLPFGPLDGAKVINWSWKPWLVAVILGISGFFLL